MTIPTTPTFPPLTGPRFQETARQIMTGGIPMGRLGSTMGLSHLYIRGYICDQPSYAGTSWALDGVLNGNDGRRRRFHACTETIDGEILVLASRQNGMPHRKTSLPPDPPQRHAGGLRPRSRPCEEDELLEYWSHDIQPPPFKEDERWMVGFWFIPWEECDIIETARSGPVFLLDCVTLPGRCPASAGQFGPLTHLEPFLKTHAEILVDLVEELGVWDFAATGGIPMDPDKAQVQEFMALDAELDKIYSRGESDASKERIAKIKERMTEIIRNSPTVPPASPGMPG